MNGWNHQPRPSAPGSFSGDRGRYEYNPALGNLAPKPEPDLTPGLFSRSDSAKFLGISQRLLHDLRREGKLLPILINSKVLYRRTDLQAFIDAQPQAPLPPKAQEGSVEA